MNVTCSTESPCPLILDSECVVYTGAILPYLGVNTNDRLETVITKIEEKVKDIYENCCDDSGGGGDIPVFENNITFVLDTGKTFGKYKNGDIAPWAGLNAVEAIEDAAIEYINPTFTSFGIFDQPTTIEVGETLSGIKPFVWNILENSGDVNAINIFDINAGSNIITSTANDGSQNVTINTIQLNSNGAIQQWRGVGINISPSGTFNSSTFTVTARYARFSGPSSVVPSNSAQVRALNNYGLVSSGGTYTFTTGTSEVNFVIALPPGRTLTSVIDLGNLNLDITSQFVLNVLNVEDAGGTNRSYNVYTMTNAIPYSVSTTFQVTFS